MPLKYLYVDGELRLKNDVTIKLSNIDDVNNWIGRSQYEEDPPLNGEVDEFRIYKRALSSEEIAKTADAGPDQLPIE